MKKDPFDSEYDHLLSELNELNNDDNKKLSILDE